MNCIVTIFRHWKLITLKDIKFFFCFDMSLNFFFLIFFIFCFVYMYTSFKLCFKKITAFFFLFFFFKFLMCHLNFFFHLYCRVCELVGVGKNVAMVSAGWRNTLERMSLCLALRININIWLEHTGAPALDERSH
jgi:hypothetical protein